MPLADWDEQKQFFETARGLFELATNASEEDRAALERCSTKFFWKACGLTMGTPTPARRR